MTHTHIHTHTHTHLTMPMMCVTSAEVFCNAYIARLRPQIRRNYGPGNLQGHHGYLATNYIHVCEREKERKEEQIKSYAASRHLLLSCVRRERLSILPFDAFVYLIQRRVVLQPLQIKSIILNSQVDL